MARHHIQQRFWDIGGILFGLLLITISFILKLPYSLDRLALIEASIVKYGLGLLGIALIVFAGISIRRPRSLAHHPAVRKYAGNIFALLLGLLFCIVIIEASLQLIQTENPLDLPPHWQWDPLLQHSMVPNITYITPPNPEFDRIEIKTNSLGLRDKEIGPKRANTVRILMLGDSFTFGHGAHENETFVRLLERKLRASGYDVEIINGGVSSYSPVLEYLYLKNKGLDLQPDIIVVNFDMSDLQDDWKYESDAILDEEGVARAVPGAPANDVNLLVKLSLQIKSIRIFQNVISALYVKFPHEQTERPWARDTQYSRYALTRHDTSAEDLAPYWNRSKKYLLLMNELSKEHNATFVLVTYPYGHQVSVREWARCRDKFGFGNDMVYSDMPMRELAHFSAAHDITYINTLPAFIAAEDRYPLFLACDGHFTRNGNIVASEALHEGMTKILNASSR